MNIVMRAADHDEAVFDHLSSIRASLGNGGRRPLPPGPRTTLHLHCFSEEARRVRDAAHRRETTISGFVLAALQRSWQVTSEIPAFQLPFSKPPRKVP